MTSNIWLAGCVDVVWQIVERYEFGLVQVLVLVLALVLEEPRLEDSGD